MTALTHSVPLLYHCDSGGAPASIPIFPTAYQRSIISGQTDVVNSPHSDLEEEGSKSELQDLTDSSYRGVDNSSTKDGQKSIQHLL